MAVPETTPSKALFFIPDISGFTQFIGDRDFLHSQYIIAELLEILMDNNSLKLTVGEVEGDAIFFYQHGSPPEMEDLILQAEQMYVAFHNHLKKYGVSRLCNCPSCQSSSRLTLKFVAHYGDASQHKVKDHIKLFGADVILVHRLLKNQVPEREYLLITDQLLNQSNMLSGMHPADWKPGIDFYDLGEVNYTYLPLAHWYNKVPEPVLVKPVTYHSGKPLIHSAMISAPIDLVYESLIDLNQRPHYMSGLHAVQIEDPKLNQLNRICTSFECSLEHEKCKLETSDLHWEENTRRFSETIKEHPLTYEYILEKKDDQTGVSIEIHPGFTFPMNWMFQLIMKKKIMSETQKSLLRLKNYCESKV